jgi:hypothetical protein
MKLISEKHPVTACFLLVLIAYLPVTSFLFAIKNDFFTAYFPLKYFLSESIHAGNFPLWNPFLNYGFPVYGDMSEGYWNPLTWLIASTVGYNPWTFTIEIVCYIFIACQSMFALAGMWMKNTWTRQLTAVAFACSGFFVGHLQHFNWIAGAALLPLCLLTILKFLKEGQLKYFLGAIISTSWFLTAAHPGMIIGLILFIIPLLIHSRFIQHRSLLRLGILLPAILLICGGMCYGYLEVLPFTNRSAPVGTLVTPAFSTGVRSWISVLMSMPITKAQAFFGNDIAMRNSFFGVLLLCSLSPIFAGKVKGTSLYFACCGLAFLVLSSEMILPIYPHIPLVNYVRLNSEFRIFAIMSFILAGGISLEYSVKWKDHTLVRSLQALRFIYIAAVVSALVFILLKGDTILKAFTGISTGKPGLKALINGISFADSVVIHGVIQLFICTLLINALKAVDYRKLVLIGFGEIAIATLLNLPFTGVGQRSVKDINELLTMAPKGITAPRMVREDEVANEYPKTDLILGPWSLYSKQIAMDSLFPYPLIFHSTLDLAASKDMEILKTEPAFFFRSKTGISRKEIAYSFQDIMFHLELMLKDTLVIKQNVYPKWQADLDGTPIPIHAAYGNFIAVALPEGKHQLTLAFRNNRIKILLFSEFLLLMVASIILFLIRKDHRIRYIFP